MLTAELKLEALKSELKMVAQNYEEARNVMNNCENKIREIQGGIKAISELIKERELDAQTEAKETVKK